MSWQAYERAPRSRRRKRFPSLFGCMAAAAIVVAVVIIGGLIALSGREAAPVLTGDDRERIADEVNRVRKTLEDIRKDADRGVARDFVVSVTDDQLNVWLSEDADIRSALTERDIEDAWVRIHDGGIHVTVLRSVGTITVQMKATMAAEISGGNDVRVRITDMTVGRLGAPRAAAERLADQIGRLLTSKIRRPNVTLTALKIVENRVEVSGRTNGPPSAHLRPNEGSMGACGVRIQHPATRKNRAARCGGYTLRVRGSTMCHRSLRPQAV